MPQNPQPYLAPSLRNDGFIGVTGTTPYRAPTADQLNTLRQAYENSFNPPISTRLPAGAIILSFNFDGTQNGLYPATGESRTNVYQLSELLKDGNGRENTFYFPGIGAQTLPSGTLDVDGRPASGSSPSNWDSVPFRAGEKANLIVERAIFELETRVNAIRAENPDADIRIVTTSHSRGGPQTAAFATAINERGIPGLFEPGQARIDHAIQFDPVNMTNGHISSKWPDGVVQSGTAIVSVDERRTIMPPMPHAPGSDRVPLPGPHSGGAGSFNQGGVGAVGLAVARNALDAAGVPIAPIPEHLQPNWDQMWMHDSSLDNYGNKIWSTLPDRYYEGSSRTDPTFTEVLRGEAPPPSLGDAVNTGEALDYQIPADPLRPDGEQLTVREVLDSRGVSQITILNSRGEVVLAAQAGESIDRDPQTGRITATDNSGSVVGAYVPSVAVEPPPAPVPQDGYDAGGDAEHGAGAAAPPSPSPSFTTIRVNTNTVFTLNEDGDIVSETVTGRGNYTVTRDMDGSRGYADASGNAITQQQYEDHQAAAAVEDAAMDGAAAIGLVNAMAGLRNWDDMSDLQRLSALTGVISQVNAASSGALVGNLGISNSALQAAGSALGFLAAAERGDTAGMVINGASFVDAVGNKVVSTAIANVLEINMDAALPGLNMVFAAARGDAMGTGTAAMSTLLAMHPAAAAGGPVLAGFVIVGSFLMGKDEPPQQHGNAQAQWGDQGELDYALQYNEGGGGKTAEKYASALMQSLQEAVAKQPELAIIPDRVPRVGWVLEPAQDNLDRVYLEWVDGSGQRHTRWYTDEGQPQPNRHGEAAGVKDIASDFVEIALSQGAIAPAAKVNELRQNWIEAMAPVVALDAQYAELDKLAEPVRPYQAMQGEQGTIWYDSVNPLRLAELQGQMAPLQQQALDLRAKARAQFEAELKGIEGVGAGAGTGNKPQTALELQFFKEVLADGSGTLHITRDGKGGEIRFLDANNTRVFDGQAEHTHGGVLDPNKPAELNIEAGDKGLLSTTNRTIASTTVQTRTTVGVDDARRTDGEEGDVLRGQDSGQQTHMGPGGSAVVGDVPSAPIASTATTQEQPAADEPATPRETVTLGAEAQAPAPSPAATAAEAIELTSTVTQGQDATQQTAGQAAVQDGTAGSEQTGQSQDQQTVQTADADSVQSDDTVTGTTTSTGDTITVTKGDSRITSATTPAPAPRAPAPAPAAGPAVAFVPQQPATQEQERRQALAAMVNSAQSASPLGGDAGLAGLAAVGVAAAGAHLGAQAQPLVAQAVAVQQQAEQAQTQSQIAAVTAPASAPAFQSTWVADAPVPAAAAGSGDNTALQLMQVNLGSYQVGGVASQPAVAAPAAAVPAEPAQPAVSAVVTVQWQGAVAAPPATAVAPVPAPAPLGVPTPVFTDGAFASTPSAPSPAPSPAPSVVPAPAPAPVAVVPAPAPAPMPVGDGGNGGGNGSGGGGNVPAPAPAPAPGVPAAQPAYIFTDHPALTQTVWSGVEDTSLVFNTGMLTAYRADEGRMTFMAVGQVTGGQAALVDGQIVFRPDPHHNGDASFSFTVQNAWGQSSIGTARLQLQAVNDAPVARADSLAGEEDRVLWLDAAALLANDADVDDTTLRITAVTGAQNGVVTLLANGDVRFTPHANYHGPAQFNYTVAEGAGGVADATVNLTVLSVNDTPVAVGESAAATEDTTLVIAAGTLPLNVTAVSANEVQWEARA